MTVEQPAGESAGRPRQASDEDIFEALIEAITEHGPHRWTMNGVASRIGLTGPALGYRFGSKHGLLIAFAAHQPDAVAIHFDTIAAAASTPHDAIIEALVGLMSASSTRTHVANNIAMLSLDLTDADLAESARQQTRVIKAKIATLVTECGIGSAMEANALAEHLYVIWSGAILSWAIDGTGTLAQWIREHLTTALQNYST